MTTVIERETRTITQTGQGSRQGRCEGCPRFEEPASDFCEIPNPKYQNRHPVCVRAVPTAFGARPTSCARRWNGAVPVAKATRGDRYAGPDGQRMRERNSNPDMKDRVGRLDRRGFYSVHGCTLVALAALAVLLGISCGPALADPPANPGYMRASKGRNSQFIIFDADTYKIYRSVKFPQSSIPYSHRLEIGPNGRIWVGYDETRDGLFAYMLRDQRRGILVFAPDGTLLHEVDILCGGSGMAFASGYAFVGCGSTVFAVDIETLAVVKRLDWEHPPGLSNRQRHTVITAVEAIGTSILAFGFSYPPDDYKARTHHSASVTKIEVIDAESLTVRGYRNIPEPGLRVFSAVDVNGDAWIFNRLSHIAERPSRVDVYVMDPRTLDIVDSFNLGQPFPQWAEQDENGFIHILNSVIGAQSRLAGFQSGFTLLNSASREEMFTAIPDLPFTRGIGVDQGRPCLTRRGTEDGGLWCMNDNGVLELKIKHPGAVGVRFGPRAS